MNLSPAAPELALVHWADGSPGWIVGGSHGEALGRNPNLSLYPNQPPRGSKGGWAVEGTGLPESHQVSPLSSVPLVTHSISHRKQKEGSLNYWLVS